MKSTSSMSTVSLRGWLVFLFVFTLAGPASAQGDSWETKASLPILLAGQATGVINGKLYVASHGVLRMYDPGTNSWANKASPPSTRGGIAGAVIDGQLYVPGGCPNLNCGGSLTNSLERYDPGTDTWTALTPMPSSRGGIAAAAIDGKLYVVGGFVSGYDTVNQLDVYDPETYTWSTLAPMPTARESMEAVAINGKLYVVGGFVRSSPGSPDGNTTGKLEVYDPVSNTWTVKAPMPTDRFEHAVGVVNGKLFAAGGNRSTSGNVNTLEEYDPATDAWVTRVPMPTARSFLGAGVINGKLYVVGPAELTATTALEVYTPPDNNPPVANAGPDQAIRPNDIVLLDGSASFDDNTASAALLYAWTFASLPGGSAATLTGADTATPSFVADVSGTYTVELVVTDEGGLSSAADQVEISSNNLAPTAAAGDDQLVIVGNSVNLNGSGSSDPENDLITYSWTLTSSPEGSLPVLLGANTATPILRPDTEGLYVVELVVSDFIGPGTPDTVEITATTAETFAEIKIQDSNEIVTSLPPSSVTTKGNQTAITNFLIQATTAIQAGDLVTARDKLEKSIERTDGCVLRGAPDGNGPGRDWITDCAAQEQAYMLLNEALAALGS